MKRLLATAAALALTLGTAGFAQAAETSGTMEHSAAQHGQSANAAQIKEAQTALKQQGFYKGEVDGEMGPQTTAAIKEFQQKQGLKKSAELDQQTLDRLNGGEKAGTSQPPAAKEPAGQPPVTGSGIQHSNPATPPASGASPATGGATKNQ